ncbi:MAG: hypothetical protein IJX84_00300 [Clostridia bacterium]|nr:hypothetical protein [Clostridia bacterium]
MPITAYCKKCARDVEPGERCLHCGGKLAKSAIRVAWCADHVPLRDWMSWNAAMRILLPLAGMVFLLVLLLEAMAGGFQAVDDLLRGGLLFALLGLLIIVAAVLLLAFILQGEDLQDCVVDGRGIHIQQYLPQPTALKLLLRLKSPSLMQQYDPEEGILLISQKELLWKDIARVQLWPEKTLILFYAPAWWMRLALPCTPFTYEDCFTFIQEKLGKKKDVKLPAELLLSPQPKPEKPKAKPAPEQAEQLSFADIPTPEPATEPEKEGDFVSLEDVLKEIQENEKQE